MATDSAAADDVNAIEAAATGGASVSLAGPDYRPQTPDHHPSRSVNERNSTHYGWCRVHWIAPV